MTLSAQTTKDIIKHLFLGEDYRIEVVTLINIEFLDFSINFFKRVIDAKLKNEGVTIDWYKKEFLNPSLHPDIIGINSGLNKKTIYNMYNSAKRQIVLDASNEHYTILYNSITKLIEDDNQIDLTLTLRFRGVSVDLNINESLVVINTLAVKRAALTGGLWSTAGKKVEKPLMLALCKLYQVPQQYYTERIKKSKSHNDELYFEREIDFYLLAGSNRYKCEVKLMGKGNPESADSTYARSSDVFIADKLSETVRRQLASRNVEWVELRDSYGFRKFSEVLRNLHIPFTDFTGDLSEAINRILNEILG